MENLQRKWSNFFRCVRARHLATCISHRDAKRALQLTRTRRISAHQGRLWFRVSAANGAASFKRSDTTTQVTKGAAIERDKQNEKEEEEQKEKEIQQERKKFACRRRDALRAECFHFKVLQRPSEPFHWKPLPVSFL